MNLKSIEDRIPMWVKVSAIAIMALAALYYIWKNLTL